MRTLKGLAKCSILTAYGNISLSTQNVGRLTDPYQIPCTDLNPLCICPE